MERCTMRDNNGTAYLKAEYDTADTLDQAVEKLAEYEDAAEAGCLVRLPVPIGTPLYYPTITCDIPSPEGCPYHFKIECSKCEHYTPEISTEEFDLYLLEHNGNIPKGYYTTKEEAQAKIQHLLEVFKEDKNDRE